MPYTIHQIAQITGGRLLAASIPEQPVEHLVLDSRRVLFPETSLFFAMRGARHDGHDFLETLYAQGLRHFIVSRSEVAARLPEANIVVVDDPIAALQALAAWRRRQFRLPVVGITGSNGKTIVKEWLFQLLHEDYRIVRSPGSYNSQTGTPLSVWQLQEGHELAIFEAGISRMGEMARLAPIIGCTIGLLTNIGEAHSEGFPSKEVKLRQKLELFRRAERLLYCRDNPMVETAVAELGRPTFSWSRTGPADVEILREERLGWQTRLEFRHSGGQHLIQVPFTDDASVENAIHCLTLLLYLGLSPDTIARRMAGLSPLPMRLELKEGINSCVVINDSYNADLNSLANALHFLDQQRREGRRTLILSDILESGMPVEELYGRIARLLPERQISRVFGIGQAVGLLGPLLPSEVETRFFPDTQSFLHALPELNFRQEIILLKGARPFAFERIAQRLSQQVHRTTLEIDLEALLHNLNGYHRRLAPGVRLMAMVKAAAYGSGSLEIARLLEFHRVDYLAVAYTDEGVELRQGGLRLPILVLNPEPAAFEELLRFDLEPELFSLQQLREFAAFCATRREPCPVHLKIDTGMHRLGFELADLEALTDTLQQSPQLAVRSVFSHLSAAEAPEHDAFTHQQARQFKAMYEPIAAALGYRPMRHLLNTGGIARFPEYQMEMVRLGIGLYGIDSGEAMAGSLRPVFHFHAHVSQIREVGPGESVGYGRRGRAQQARRIATISAGYADGLPRAAGQGRYAVAVRGRRAAIVGSICMDMCMIDVSGMPEVQEGDPVVIFGHYPPVEELAQAAETIPYEILTGISGRVRRVYVQG